MQAQAVQKCPDRSCAETFGIGLDSPEHAVEDASPLRQRPKTNLIRSLLLRISRTRQAKKRRNQQEAQARIVLRLDRSRRWSSSETSPPERAREPLRTQGGTTALSGWVAEIGLKP